MTVAEDRAALSAAEMDQFREQGFLGPFTLCSPEEMAELRALMVGWGWLGD